MSRYNSTIQFPEKNDYDRLRELAKMEGTTIGETIDNLVDAEESSLGIKIPVIKDNPRKPRRPSKVG